MDNQSLYKSLNAAYYVGRNGILYINLRECRNEDVCTIVIIGTRFNYQQKISIIELATMNLDLLPILMENIYYEYVALCEQKEDLKHE